MFKVSKITLEKITDKEYEHAQKVWGVFEIKTNVNIMIYVSNAIHYCLQMCLETLEINVSKYINMILLNSYRYQD